MLFNYHFQIGCFVFIVGVATVTYAQYEDSRCICVCPGTEVVNSTTYNKRKLYISNVQSNHCNCEGVVLPQTDDIVRKKYKEFCPHCDCTFENRKITTIRVVVILIIWVISLLVVYMLFLMCLDPLMNKKRGTYQEQTNEEVNLDEPLPTVTRPRASSSNVLNRVGLQQDKWKRQVQEQRRNIYDRHTMLN